MFSVCISSCFHVQIILISSNIFLLCQLITTLPHCISSSPLLLLFFSSNLLLHFFYIHCIILLLSFNLIFRLLFQTLSLFPSLFFTHSLPPSFAHSLCHSSTLSLFSSSISRLNKFFSHSLLLSLFHSLTPSLSSILSMHSGIPVVDHTPETRLLLFTQNRETVLRSLYAPWIGYYH